MFKPFRHAIGGKVYLRGVYLGVGPVRIGSRIGTGEASSDIWVKTQRRLTFAIRWGGGFGLRVYGRDLCTLFCVTIGRDW